MNKAEKATVNAQIRDESKCLEELRKAYKQAKKDVQERLKALNARTDMQNLQTIIHQRKYQEQLLKQIDSVLNDLETHSYKTANEFFQGSYQNGYIGSMYELMKQGIPITVPVSTQKMVTAIQTDSKLSKTYYLKKGLSIQNIRTLKKQIALEATRGIASGKSWLEVAESLAVQRAFAISQSDAIRIVRTEGNRINQQGRLDSGDEAVKAGCDLLKQWDATLDGRTRESHREADGQIVEWDEDFTVGGEKMKAPSIGGSASNVCNCRCQLLKRPRWALDDEELEVLKKRAEYFGLDKSDSFDEFKKKYLNLPENANVVPTVLGESFEDQMKVVQDRVKQQGYATEDDLHEAGNLVKREYDKVLGDRQRYQHEADLLIEKKKALDAEVQKLSEEMDRVIDKVCKEAGIDEDDFFGRLIATSENSEIDTIQKRIDAILQGKEYQDLSDEISRLLKLAKPSAFDTSEKLKGVLSKIRSMGHPDIQKSVAKSSSPMRQILIDAMDKYPTSWIEKAIGTGGVKVKKVSRGYCDPWENLIALSGWGDEDSFGTAVHELGHYFDHKASINEKFVSFKDSGIRFWKKYEQTYYPDGKTFILNAEREFYKKRTAGEDLNWLGAGYKRTEKTRRDNFIHPYMGKDYDGINFELVSMGFQYAYTEPWTLAKDPDMESWIYGILALYE